MLKPYISYLRDNPNRYWFRRKLYGWGWTPVTWQGWSVTLGFVLLMIGNSLRLEDRLNAGDTKEFFLETIALICLLVWIGYKKGEPPKWQWGIPKKTDENNE